MRGEEKTEFSSRLPDIVELTRLSRRANSQLVLVSLGKYKSQVGRQWRVVGLVSVPLGFHRKRSLKLVVRELLSVPLSFHNKQSLKLAASQLVSVPLSFPALRGPQKVQDSSWPPVNWCRCR